MWRTARSEIHWREMLAALAPYCCSILGAGLQDSDSLLWGRQGRLPLVLVRGQG